MKKNSLDDFLRKKRTLRRLKRKSRKNRSTPTPELIKRQKRYTELCRKISRSKLSLFLLEKKFTHRPILDEISIPKSFDFKTDQALVCQKLKEIHTALQSDLDRVKISFKSCQKISLASIVVLKALMQNHSAERIRLNGSPLNRYIKVPRISIEDSEDENVSQLLNAANLSEGPKHKKDSTNNPVFCLGFTKGKANRKAHTENTKGRLCKEVVEFINHSIKRRSAVLDKTGVNSMTQMIGEILSNAEDHSLGKEWYIMGTLHEDTEDSSNIIGILDLVILNFGDSIYEGFMKDKYLNLEQHLDMEKVYQHVKDNTSERKLRKFSESSFFTLFALQEGVSRLKYKEQSRGSGTVNFIDAFLFLGSYINNQKGYHPELSIISGDTIITCDNEFKPKAGKNGLRIVALNKENDLTLIPSKRHVIKLPNSFPGTVLTVKIFFSTDHFEKLISNYNGS